MVIIGLALIGALIVAAIFVLVRFALASALQHPIPVADQVRWGASIFVGNLLLDLVILYFGLPALTGPYNGWHWLLWPMFLTGLVALFASSITSRGALVEMLMQQGGMAPRRRPRVVNARTQQTVGFGRTQTALFVLGIVLLTTVVINGIIVVATTWFDPNAHALAHIPRIISESRSTPLPPTDVNHIVLVSQGVAAFEGQTVLGQGGANLGSTFHTEPDDYTLQSVQHHLYWIAPLVYNNVFANLSRGESPGYVVVDAEDPNAQPQLKTGYHLRYLPGAILNQDLIRHVYLSGYTYGELADPTLEVRDDWRPFFTISLMQPTRGFTGETLRAVLLADPQTGGVQSFASPGRTPAWVDRVIPADTVTQYLTWWGKYNNLAWFNPSGIGQQQPSTATPELVYNSVDNPVWLVPMTSSAMSDNSSTGVVLFDTHDNTGRFYPLAGLGVTSNVEATFRGNPHNLRGYDVGAVQLYQIYGVPTWVAIFVTSNSYGDQYQAIGMVDARHLSGANVIMAGTKSDALAAYAQSLASASGPGSGPSSSGQVARVQGTVQRVAAATQNGATVYYLLLQGQTRLFEANLSLSAELPLVREGDTVSLSYIDTGQPVVTATSFDDLDITVAAPSPTPATTP